MSTKDKFHELFRVKSPLRHSSALRTQNLIFILSLPLKRLPLILKETVPFKSVSQLILYKVI